MPTTTSYRTVVLRSGKNEEFPAVIATTLPTHPGQQAWTSSAISEDCTLKETGELLSFVRERVWRRRRDNAVLFEPRSGVHFH